MSIFKLIAAESARKKAERREAAVQKLVEALKEMNAGYKPGSGQRPASVIINEALANWEAVSKRDQPSFTTNMADRFMNLI